MDPAIPVLIDTNFEEFSSEITTGRLVIYIYAVSKTRHVWLIPLVELSERCTKQLAIVVSQRACRIW